MSHFSYVALDSAGRETTGLLDVADQSEAIRRLKEMGFYPTRVVQRAVTKAASIERRPRSQKRSILHIKIPGLGSGVSRKVLCAFTRQLATMIEAGMPVLRGLRLLEEQETNRDLKRIIGEISAGIEDGGTLSESLARHPKVFNGLYVNMVKAGEVGGVLDLALKRLAEFIEKANKIKSKVVAGLFYPAAVVTVAIAVLAILLVFVVPKFKEVFAGLLNGKAMPAFTVFVLNVSDFVKSHFLIATAAIVLMGVLFRIFVATKSGRRIFDRLKLKMPVVGPVIRKAAISRFCRTFGTLVSSGVPMLQTLTIVRQTCGNMIVSEAVGSVYESVKEGETISAPLKASGVFPSVVVGMIDVGEQTGALPEMLMKIADNYDDEVDDAVAAMTSLLEPIMIVFLAVVVGGIVIALFWPIIDVINGLSTPGAEEV